MEVDPGLVGLIELSDLIRTWKYSRANGKIIETSIMQSANYFLHSTQK